MSFIRTTLFVFSFAGLLLSGFPLVASVDPVDFYSEKSLIQRCAVVHEEIPDITPSNRVPEQDHRMRSGKVENPKFELEKNLIGLNELNPEMLTSFLQVLDRTSDLVDISGRQESDTLSKTIDIAVKSVIESFDSDLSRKGWVLESLYLIVKQEEYRYARDYLIRGGVRADLSAELTAHLKGKFSKTFKMEGLSVDDLLQFYVNRLRYFLYRISDDILLAYFYLWAHENESPSHALIQRKITERGADLWYRRGLVHAALWPTDLYERTFTPSEADSFFKEEPWKRLQQAYKGVFSTAFGSDLSGNETTLEKRARSFREWRNFRICCVTGSGCYDCRLNRSVIR